MTCVRRVSCAIGRILTGELIRWPSSADVDKWEAYNRERFHMPGAVCSMDGTHIPIMRMPLDSHSLYYNQKQHGQALIAHIVVSPL